MWLSYYKNGLFKKNFHFHLCKILEIEWHNNICLIDIAIQYIQWGPFSNLNKISKNMLKSNFTYYFRRIENKFFGHFPFLNFRIKFGISIHFDRIVWCRSTLSDRLNKFGITRAMTTKEHKKSKNGRPKGPLQAVNNQRVILTLCCRKLIMSHWGINPHAVVVIARVLETYFN